MELSGFLSGEARPLDSRLGAGVVFQVRRGGSKMRVCAFFFRAVFNCDLAGNAAERSSVAFVVRIYLLLSSGLFGVD